MNLSPPGKQKLVVPKCDLKITVRVGNDSIAAVPRLETVWIEASRGRMILTFRAAAPCDKRALQVAGACIRLKRCVLS